MTEMTRCSVARLGDSTQRGTVSHNHASTSAWVEASRRELEKGKGHHHHCHRHHHRRRSVKMSELKEVNIDAKKLHSVDNGVTDDLVLSTTLRQLETISEGRFIFNFISIPCFQLWHKIHPFFHPSIHPSVRPSVRSSERSIYRSIRRSIHSPIHNHAAYYSIQAHIGYL